MPRQSLQAGIPWEWTTHGEYLDALERKPLGLNVATLVGHCAVRQYAMGEASVEREANDAEIAEMEELGPPWHGGWRLWLFDQCQPAPLS